jgi:phage gpG-like protein
VGSMITIQVRNPLEVQNLLDRFQRKVDPNGITLILQNFGATIEKSIQKNFDDEGRPTRWAPLKPATVRAWLRKRSSWMGTKFNVQIGGVRMGLSLEGGIALGGRKILTDTTRLRSSVHSIMLDRTTLSVRAATEYAATHHFGLPRKNIPALPFMMVQPEDWETFKSQIQAFLTS